MESDGAGTGKRGASQSPCFSPMSHHGRPEGARPHLHADRFYEILGVEKPQAEVARLLRHLVQEEKPPVVGALHLTCADEAEKECVDAFQRDFDRYLLPTLKLSERSPFRLANLGARYEWGAAPIAEEHFSLAHGADKWKLVLIKINAHVAADDGPQGPRFGHLQRFDEDSAFCGAITATLGGVSAPFADDLTEIFGFEGFDRLAVLRDPGAVDPALRSFYASVVSARLQARRAMIDVQDHTPRTPTVYVIVPCVSLNRRGHDTEIVCGVYTSDHRGSEPADEYCGLGDDPRDYELVKDGGTFRFRGPDLRTPRLARCHRTLVHEAGQGAAAIDDPHLKGGLQAVTSKHDHRHLPHAKLALKALLLLLCEVNPIPAAMLLFGAGAVGIHHTAKAHRLAREAGVDQTACAMLQEIQGQIGGMEPEQAQHLVTLLLDAYGH